MLRAKVGALSLNKLLLTATLAAGLFTLLFVATNWPLLSKSDSVTEVEVSIPEVNGYEFIGRIDQNGADFTGYGYLYSIDGLEAMDLFSNPLLGDETTARFTYYATATLSARAILTDADRGIFALDSVGTISFYYQPTPSATFSNPLSFAGGTQIAVAEMRYQDILNVQGPNRGIAVGNGEFTIVSSTPFSIGAESYVFGSPGQIHYVSTFGEGRRTNAVVPISSVLMAGNAVTSRPKQISLPAILNESD